MSNTDTMRAVLRNLGCTCHLPTLTSSKFFSGRQANYKLEAMVRLRSTPSGGGYWELVDPDSKPLLCISFQNRESALACIASDDFNTFYNRPGYDNAENVKTLARCFGGVAWG